MDEFSLIERFFKPLCREGAPLTVGIGDDAAVYAVDAGTALVCAVDTIVAGVHFPTTLDAADIAYRAVAVNLSDIAAMGAEPLFATLALTLPEPNEDWLARFAVGLGDGLAYGRVNLIGGDTTRGSLTVTMQVTGRVDGQAMTRAGARTGDLVCVSGTLGDAAAGLEILLQEGGTGRHRAALVERFCRPTPRLALGRAMRPLAHAAIDISDGFIADIGHIAKQSGCAVKIEVDALPLSPALCDGRTRVQALELAATAGDDYELGLVIAPADRESALAAAADCGVRLTVVGRVSTGSGVTCSGADGAKLDLDRRGYRHFG